MGRETESIVSTTMKTIILFLLTLATSLALGAAIAIQSVTLLAVALALSHTRQILSGLGPNS